MRFFVYTSCVFAFLGLFLSGGCIFVEQSDRRDLKGFTVVGTTGYPEEHISISTYGYYLFNCIPLCCGNTDPESPDAITWFSDEVNLSSVQRVLIDEVKARKCQVADIQPHCQSTCFFSAIPYIGNTLGIFWYREVQISATLVRDPVMKTADEMPARRSR